MICGSLSWPPALESKLVGTHAPHRLRSGGCVVVLHGPLAAFEHSNYPSLSSQPRPHCCLGPLCNVVLCGAEALPAPRAVCWCAALDSGDLPQKDLPPLPDASLLLPLQSSPLSTGQPADGANGFPRARLSPAKGSRNLMSRADVGRQPRTALLAEYLPALLKD